MAPFSRSTAKGWTAPLGWLPALKARNLAVFRDRKGFAFFQEDLAAADLKARVEHAECSMAFDADGHIQAAYIDFVSDCGAYPTPWPLTAAGAVGEITDDRVVDGVPDREDKHAGGGQIDRHFGYIDIEKKDVSGKGLIRDGGGHRAQTIGEFLDQYSIPFLA